MVMGRVADALEALKNLGGSDIGSSVAELGQEKVRDAISAVLKDLNAMYDIIDETGFIVSDIAIELTLVPSVRLFIDQTEDASLDRIDATSQRSDLTAFQKGLLKVIKQSYHLSGLTEEHDHQVEFVEVSLTIPPAVTAHLRPKRAGSIPAAGAKRLLS